ncbi:MAG: type 1 glutamine amidotransferase [Candidatus Omnitrophota bacterium]
MILIIKHAAHEGPGTLGEYFGNRSRTIDLGRGDRLPKTSEGIAAIISMGGPMNVYEEERYPFLKDEDLFLKDALRRAVPFIGICLGAQLLAKAAGATVVKAPERETGWHAIGLTREGIADPLFAGLEESLTVFQWHEDMFEVPAGGVLLARSAACPHQAFRIGTNAYGLQFHVEVTLTMIEAWLAASGDPSARRISRESPERLRALDSRASRIYANFNTLL